MTYRVLVVDDEESIRYTFSEFLSEAGYRVDTACNAEEARTFIATQRFDVVFLDILLGSDNGMDILKFSKELNPNCPVLMVTGSPEISTAAEAVRLSAYDYLLKPVRQDELVKHAERAVAYKKAIDDRERFMKRMRAVFQGVAEGVLIFSPGMEVIDINHSAMKMLHIEESPIGRKLGDIAEGNKILTELEGLVESRVEGELFKLEFIRESGESLLLSISLSPLISGDGRDDDLVMVLRDESLPVREVAV